MARSHHRKKHKEHVRQFKHSHETNASAASKKGKATLVFGILGGVLGFAIGYFGASGNIAWMVAGLVIGAGAGYLMGRRIDREKL